jgi:hypothetical protein
LRNFHEKKGDFKRREEKKRGRREKGRDRGKREGYY